MLRYLWVLSVLLGGLLLVACALSAQEPSPEPGPMPPPPMIYMQDWEAGPIGERIELLGFEGGGGGKVVKGSPFSAVAVSESVQTLSDGNTLRRSTKSALYRDSEGRFRREVTLPAIGPFAASGKSHTFTSIHDPVGSVSYVLEPEDKIARKLPARPGGRRNHFKGEGQFVPKERPGHDSADLKTESLGTQTINGVVAEGTRHTRTIPAGQFGNDKPITIVSERWYSPDLQMVVMSKRTDPRFGASTYQLTNIQRTEPSATLFQVPSDYTVKEGGPRVRGRRGAREFNIPIPPHAAPPNF